MAKNILIFSDGTGHAGGIKFDEDRTNVYKLYRASGAALTPVFIQMNKLPSTIRVSVPPPTVVSCSERRHR